MIHAVSLSWNIIIYICSGGAIAFAQMRILGGFFFSNYVQNFDVLGGVCEVIRALARLLSISISIAQQPFHIPTPSMRQSRRAAAAIRCKNNN
jgi:hypothetical protein